MLLVGFLKSRCFLLSPAILLPSSAADAVGTTAATFIPTVTFSPTAFAFQFYSDLLLQLLLVTRHLILWCQDCYKFWKKRWIIIRSFRFKLQSGFTLPELCCRNSLVEGLSKPSTSTYLWLFTSDVSDTAAN